MWTIRNVSYDFRVAPLSEGSEMLMIRPENADFVFPAGRYGLVIKGQAYDLTVAGQITEAAQCLEGVKASNGTFYSESRQPMKNDCSSARFVSTARCGKQPSDPLDEAASTHRAQP